MGKQVERWSVGELTDRYSKLDYMTQRTIANEFPDFFGTWSPKQDTSNIEHFSDKRIISFENIWAGFGIALTIITGLSYLLEWIF